MSAPTSTSPILPLSWSDVLDNVAAMLHEAEAEALRSEQALLPAAATVKPNIAAHVYHERLEERFRAMQECLGRAEQVAADADGACRLSEEALSGWLHQLESARQKLAATATLSL